MRKQLQRFRFAHAGLKVFGDAEQAVLLSGGVEEAIKPESSGFKVVKHGGKFTYAGWRINDIVLLKLKPFGFQELEGFYTGAAFVVVVDFYHG